VQFQSLPGIEPQIASSNSSGTSQLKGAAGQAPATRDADHHANQIISATGAISATLRRLLIAKGDIRPGSWRAPFTMVQSLAPAD
jgi:hypothetical protein